MKELFLSVFLFSYGAFCDLCANISTSLAEKRISKNKELNKKLLIFMSNFSHSNLSRWQKSEQKIIAMLLRDNRKLP